MRRRAVLLGIAAVVVAWMWQFLTVRYNYGGNWTALFCIAPHMPVPDFLRSENLYIFHGSAGFDGQEYHLIAHDPWMRRGSADAIVGPAIFYQRILVPALAWALGLGRDAWIDRAYYAVVLGFVFLGVYWSAQIAARAGVRPEWGLAFLLTPAALTSIDRMTVDVAVAAFVAGFVWYAEEGPSWKVFALLACAALTKEQAVPMIAAYAVYLATRKRFGAAVWMAAATLPTVAWFAYLEHMQPAPPLLFTMSWIPMAGFFDALAHPATYPFTRFKNAAGVAFDYVALAGYAMAMALTVRFAWQRRWNPGVSAAYVLAIASMAVRNPINWTVYSFGRGLTPLFLLVAFEELAESPWLAALPMLLIDSRISLNFVSQILGVIGGITGVHPTGTPATALLK
jgi:hypothetical protein